MNSSVGDKTKEVGAKGVRFVDEMLVIELDDDRELSLPFTKIKELEWLVTATPEQKAHWQIEPYGYAIWWPEFDDGIEVVHALSLQPVT